MAKFQFRLQTLLKIREATLDEQRNRLAQAMEAEDTLREQGEEIDEQIAELRQSYHDAADPGQIQVDRLVDTQRYEVVLKTQRQEHEAREKLLATELERRRQAVIDADREVRVLEKLKEKQATKHRAEMARLEIKQFDEIAGRMRPKDEK